MNRGKKSIGCIAKTAIASFLATVMLGTGAVEILASVSSTNNDGIIIDKLKNNLLLYSSFDGENVNDESGKGHNGTVVGSVSYVDGMSGKAIVIDGNQAGTGSGKTDYAATNYVNYGPSANIIPATGDFTVSMMFKFTGETLPYGGVLLSNKDYTRGINAGFAIVAGDETSSRRQRMNFGDGSDNRNASKNASIGDGQWHMVTGVYDRDGKVMLYVDGVYAAEDNISGSNGKSLTSAGLPLILGADGDKCYGMIDSVIDELCIYDKVLSADEISELYNYYTETITTADYVTDGLVSMYDGIHNTKDGQNVAASVWEDMIGSNDMAVLSDSTSGFNSSGYLLKDNKIALPNGILNVLSGSEFTMEFLVKDLAVNGIYGNIITTDDDSLSLYYYNGDNANELRLNAKGGGIDGLSCTAAANDLSLLQDASISVTYKAGDECVVYVNGVKQVSKSVTSAAVLNGSEVFVGFAGSGDGAHPQEMLYRSMRFYDRALSADEIKQNAIADIPNYVTSGLVSLYDGKMNTADGQDMTSDVWHDLISGYDMGSSESSVTANGAFDERGYTIKGTKISAFPTQIADLMRGNSFTVEFLVSDYVNNGNRYANIISSSADTLSLFLEIEQDILVLKSGTTKNNRPTVSGGEEILKDALVSLTFEKGGEASLYINGVKRSTVTVSYQALKSGESVVIGRNDGLGDYTMRYSSMRFYNRALTSSEIQQNAIADGMLGFYNPGYISVAQPVTNIVGDIAAAREINSADELTAMMSTNALPAAAIYTVNSSLEVIDGNGDKIGTLQNVLTRTRFSVLPVIVPTDTAAVAAIVEYLNTIELYDVCIMSEDASLVKSARNSQTILRGALDLREKYKNRTELTLDDLCDIRATVCSNNATVALLPAETVTKDDIQKLYEMQIITWVCLSDTPTDVEKYNALLSGAVGIVTDDTVGILDIACNKLSPNTLTRASLNVGHRGVPKREPENTIQSSLLAYELGANCIEMDVYMSADGELVVMHDDTTGRTCNANISVQDSTWEQLSKLYINEGTTAAPDYTNKIPIPRLNDYFEAFKDTDCHLFIEVCGEKSNIVAPLKALIDEYGMYDRCTVITFETHVMAEMRKTYPEMPIGYLVGATSYGIVDGTESDMDMTEVMKRIGEYNAMYALYKRYNAKEAIRASLIRGIALYPWTMSESEIQKAFAWGYSGLTSDIADAFGGYAIDGDVGYVPNALAVNDTLNLKMALTSYSGKVTVLNGMDIILLEGEDIVNLNGSALTVTGVGKVSLMLEYKYGVGSNTVAVRTQPVTFSVIEKGVAIDRDGTMTYYDTLKAALTASQSGDVVKLVADVKETNITLSTSGVVLDLCGNKLTVNTLYAVKGTSIVDTCNGKGRLVVNSSATLLDTQNSYGGKNYVAMHLTESDNEKTYAFMPMLLQTKSSGITDSALSVKVRPVVDMGEASQTTETTNGLFDDGVSDNGLSFIVRVTWTYENGNLGKQEFAFADALIAQAYGQDKAMTLALSGIPANTALSVDLVVSSALGAELVSNIYTK